MPLALILLPLVAQASALGQGIAGLNLPQLDRPATAPNPRRPKGVIFDIPTPPSRLKACLDMVDGDPAEAANTARVWLEEAAHPSPAAGPSASGTPAASVSATAQPQLCLGSALAAQGQWAKAEAAFTAGRDAAASDMVLRSQLAGMAGNAVLAQGISEAHARRALGLLDTAQGDALAAGKTTLAGGIALDRSRALVALNQSAEAEKALSSARTYLPDEPQVWLLSATLSRRMGNLPNAQVQIETAARLAPQDAEIGVEAGVIAILSGHEDAARKSWESVLKTAPNSPFADRAAAYLAQLSPVSTTR
jgi:tetratricopeptide (TPR) repeat protein